MIPSNCKPEILCQQISHRWLTVAVHIRGNVPRQLALEVLDSLQKILFPSDSESQSLLRSLVSKAFFDPDCLRFESAPYRSDDENKIAYHYFGSRLMDLYDEVENPRPRGLMEKWLELVKTSPRPGLQAT